MQKNQQWTYEANSIQVKINNNHIKSIIQTSNEQHTHYINKTHMKSTIYIYNQQHKHEIKSVHNKATTFILNQQ